jgi:hypothetical protein
LNEREVYDCFKGIRRPVELGLDEFGGDVLFLSRFGGLAQKVRVRVPMQEHHQIQVQAGKISLELRRK